MSARARRRRARAEALPETARPRRPLRLPLLPLVAAAAGLMLIVAAWTTSWSPGPPRAVDGATRFTLEIPQNQQNIINSWERFFICYDLLDPAVVDLTLRANQRATGSLDFPGERVEVELPAPRPSEEAQERPAGGAEDELIAARQAVLGAAVPARMAQIRQQCAGTSG
ncbi:MAG TPA: hypothetical protein VGB54_06325 [Allosphingosinicella sp.]|jgi:hypothetical protein